jgi:curved DNA-binding protein CbpA
MLRAAMRVLTRPHAARQVLRDEHKRAEYDVRRRGVGGASFGSASPASAASGAWRPGASGFDEAFASWYERQGCALGQAALLAAPDAADSESDISTDQP